MLALGKQVGYHDGMVKRTRIRPAGSPKLGPPFMAAKDRRTSRPVYIRLTSAERAEVDAVAGKSVTKWARAVLLMAARIG